MKKLLILCALSSVIPAFATCSIDKNAACIADIQSFTSTNPVLQQSVNFKSTSDFGKNYETISPVNSSAQTGGRKFSPTSNDYSYNSNCQFGLCINSGTKEPLKD